MKEKYGSPFGYGVYFRGGMGAEAIRELLAAVDLETEAKSLREIIKTSKGQKLSRAVKRLKVVEGFLRSDNKPGVDDPAVHPGHPAGTAPHGAARRRPLRHLRPQRPLSPGHQP